MRYKRVIIKGDHLLLLLLFMTVPSQPPQSVQAYALSSHSLMLSWSPAPAYSLNGVLQGYKLIYKAVRDDEGNTWNILDIYLG